MPNPRLSVIPLLQTWDPAAGRLEVNVLFMPDADPRRPLSDGWSTPIPAAPAFEGAELVLRAAFPGDPLSLPTRADVAAAGSVHPLAVPGEQSAVLDELEARFRIVLPPTPVARSTATRLGKYLPESYRASFAFVAPKTPLAFTDDTYHCALRCRPTVPPRPARPLGEVSWPEALAFALRHPFLARALGLVHAVTVNVANEFVNGGWLYFALDATSAFAPQAVAQADFVRLYATRVPPLPAGGPRAVFTPTVFPVAADATGMATFGNMDEALHEAATYDDGFTRIVHASQPRTIDPIEEGEDGSPPMLDLGLAIGWDDEDVLVAQNRAMGVEPDGSIPPIAPQVLHGYRIDVSTRDDPTWRSLCRARASNVVFGPVALGDLEWEQPYEVHPRRINDRFFLPIMFARWRGRSLVATTREDRLLTGIATDVGPPDEPIGLEHVGLRWGTEYRVRVRLADLSGGGPDPSAEPDAPTATQIARVRFRRFVPPGAPGVVATGAAQPATTYSIARPMLGYPEATFTRIPDARARLIAQMEAAISGDLDQRPALHDPDAEAIEIAVRVRMPAFDPSADFDGYRQLYVTYRSFPTDPALPATVNLKFVDAARLADHTWDAPPAFPGPSTGPIEVPTDREVRVSVRAVTRDDPDYMGNQKARRGPWRELSSVPFNAPGAAVVPVFGPTTPDSPLASVFLQPDPPAASRSSDEAPEEQPSRKLAGRLADAVGLLEDGGTMLNEPGRRVTFACAGLKHHLPPDRSSIALTATAELARRWLNVIRLPVDRDWSWQGLQSPGFLVRRTLRAVGAPGDPVESATLLEVEVHHAVNDQAVRGEVDRDRAELVLLDAVPAWTLDGLPYEIEVIYEVEALLSNGTSEFVTLRNRLPVTTPPAQTPKVVSVGHAFGDYEIGDRYASTRTRARRLWVEFAEPPIDTRDGYFVRALTNAPDPMLLPGIEALNEPVGYDQPTLDPEVVRVVRPSQSEDFAGLHVMQPLEGSTTGRHFLVPLPPNLSDSAPELFGFFSYEICVGHRRGSPSSPFWSTAQGRFGPSVVLDGVQHPPPWIDCQVRFVGEDLVATATFAQTVANGRRLTAEPPNTELWVILYCQVQQADAASFRNVLLDRRPTRLPRRGGDWPIAEVARHRVGNAIWRRDEVEDALARLGLPSDMPLSVLAVELLPEPNGTFADPLGGDLGEVRILRTSPLVAVDRGCC